MDTDFTAKLFQDKKLLNASDRAEVEHWEMLIKNSLNVERKKHMNDTGQDMVMSCTMLAELDAIFAKMIDRTVCAMIYADKKGGKKL